MLTRLGYTVTGLNDAEAVLARFRAAPQDVDLVITDMTMPKMTGLELAARLMAIRPDIPVILFNRLQQTTFPGCFIRNRYTGHCLQAHCQIRNGRNRQTGAGRTGEVRIEY